MYTSVIRNICVKYSHCEYISTLIYSFNKILTYLPYFEIVDVA